MAELGSGGPAWRGPCRSALLGACRKTCPQDPRVKIGRNSEVRYDRSRTSEVKGWRCYDGKALTSDRRQYNMSSSRRQAVCSRHALLLRVMEARCNTTDGVQAGAELQEWPEDGDDTPVCGRVADESPWPLDSPACLDPARCSAFANVSLLLQVSHAARVSLLLGYVRRIAIRKHGYKLTSLSNRAQLHTPARVRTRGILGW